MDLTVIALEINTDPSNQGYHVDPLALGSERNTARTNAQRAMLDDIMIKINADVEWDEIIPVRKLTLKGL